MKAYRSAPTAGRVAAQRPTGCCSASYLLFGRIGLRNSFGVRFIASCSKIVRVELVLQS